MSLFWTSRAYLAIAICLAIRTTSGTPHLSFPINSQLPPVAYVEQPYQFTFSPTTFTSGSSEILYILAGNPAWLSIDSSSRRLSGTPTHSDVGAASFRLIASDKIGQATSNVVLVILQNNTISADADILIQLEEAGSVSAPTTLLLHQLQYFSFTIPVDTFRGISSKTNYYAVSADGSPLPSWLQFDPTNLRFSGTTPPRIAPTPESQTYDFKLAASSVAGFSEVEVRFQILIGSHLLAFTNPEQKINITRGDHVQISTLLQQLTMDGRRVSRSDLSSVTSTAPDWLNLNDTDLSFDGEVPLDAESGTFVVSAFGSDSNTANATMLLQVYGAQVASEVDFGSYNVITGTFFSQVIKRPMNVGKMDNVTADLGVLASWLGFNPQNMTLYGAVPTSLVPQTLTASITFSNTTSIVVGALKLDIVVQLPNTSITTFYPRSSGGAPSQPAVTSTNNAPPGIRQTSTHRRNIIRIVLSTVLPVTFLLMVLAILICVMHKKRANKERVLEATKTGKCSPVPDHGVILINQSSTVSTPIPGPQLTRQYSAVRPPRIELVLAPDSMRETRKRLSTRPRTVRSSIIGPSWDDLIRLPTPTLDSGGSNTSQSTVMSEQDEMEVINQAPVQSTAANTAHDDVITHSSLEQVDHPRMQRMSAVPSSTTLYTAGVPKRISGAGHGAGTKDARSNPSYRSSWQTTFGTMPLVNSRPTTILREPFLLPRAQTGVANADSRPKNWPCGDIAPTLWLVDPSGDGANVFETARQQLHNDHAGDQLEGSSRFTDTSQSQKPLNIKLETEAGRPALNSLSEDEIAAHNRYSSQSWSQWSAIGPAASPHGPTAVARPVGDHSLASSRQFDSAISSDSQWEDEDLVADENSVGERYWQTNIAAPPFTANSRLPFEQDGRESEDGLAAERRTRFNLADQRKRASMGETELQRNQRSHKGSFRFI